MTTGIDPVGPGMVATVVTMLELTARPRPGAIRALPFRLDRWHQPSPDAYRALFRRVGAPWLWFSRLVLDDAALAAILVDPAVEVHVVRDRHGIEVGFVELDFQAGDSALIRYFGVIPELTGRGVGGWLMAHCLALAWRPGIERVQVNTCTLDHPAALGFYRRHGFVAVGRAVERFPDPRLTGLIAEDQAPHIPIIRPIIRAD